MKMPRWRISSPHDVKGIAVFHALPGPSHRTVRGFPETGVVKTIIVTEFVNDGSIADVSSKILAEPADRGQAATNNPAGSETDRRKLHPDDIVAIQRGLAHGENLGRDGGIQRGLAVGHVAQNKSHHPIQVGAQICGHRSSHHRFGFQRDAMQRSLLARGLQQPLAKNLACIAATAELNHPLGNAGPSRVEERIFAILAFSNRE